MPTGWRLGGCFVSRRTLQKASDDGRQGTVSTVTVSRGPQNVASPPEQSGISGGKLKVAVRRPILSKIPLWPQFVNSIQASVSSELRVSTARKGPTGVNDGQMRRLIMDGVSYYSVFGRVNRTWIFPRLSPNWLQESRQRTYKLPLEGASKVPSPPSSKGSPNS